MAEKLALDSLKSELRPLTKSSLLPPEVSNRLGHMLGRVQIMSSVPFKNFKLGDRRRFFSEEGIQLANHQLSPYNGAYNFTYLGTEKDRIGILDSFYTTADKDKVLNLLSEEVGHSMTTMKRSPLIEIQDGSDTLLPHTTRKSLVDALAGLMKQHKHLYLNPPSPTIENIEVAQTGWKQILYDKESRFEYPVIATEINYEELRSAVIQTLLMSFYYGRGVTQIDRFVDGTKKLEEKQERNYEYKHYKDSRILAGLTILKEIYANNGCNEETVRTLFGSLYDSTHKQFIQQWNLDPTVFQRSLDYINNEINL